MTIPPELETKARDAIAENWAARRVLETADPDDQVALAMQEAAVRYSQDVRAQLAEWDCEEYE